jgi:hypothetical protein
MEINPAVYTKPTPDQHIYHHNDNDGPRIYVKVVQNTKGFNYEATVSDAKTVGEAMALLMDAEAKLKAKYGSSEPA